MFVTYLCNIMKILIILHNRVYADYIGYRLKRQGHEVRMVNKKIEIIPLLLHQYWDIAIIGISVGYYNGLEILDLYNRHYDEYARKSEKEIPKKTKIYILSTIQDKRCMTNAKLLGAAGYFRVPQNTNVFLDHIIKNDLCDQSM